MSDNILKLVPQDPEFMPQEETLEKAKSEFASFVPNADEVTAKISEDIVFVDPGSNFGNVSCPKCSVDITDWWSKEGMISVSENGHFESLEVTTPCCGAKISLNDLVYSWPVGFSRFSLEALNPQIKDLSDDQMHSIEKHLGSPLKKIWAHY